jgi:DNA repair protein RecO (recombination protein O)
MAYYKTVGIVLRRMNLGEADRIITVLTRDYGKVRAVAKGVRRIKSRMAGHLEPFGTVELMFAVGRNLDIVTSARLMRSGDSISNTPQSLSYGFLLADMIDKLTEEGVSQSAVYDMTEACYADLSQRGGDAVLELFFKLRLLDALGYKPGLDGCSICGGRGAAAEYFFVPELGSIVDDACVTYRQLPMSASQIKLWRLMLSHPLEQLRRLEGVVEQAATSLGICHLFYDYTFGKRFLVGNAIFE